MSIICLMASFSRGVRVYYFAFILLSLFSLVEICYKKSIFNNLYFLLLVFLLTAIAALRYNVGTDWPAYEYMFYNQQELLAQNIELGFSFVYNILSWANFNFVILFISALCFMFLVVFLAKSVQYKTIALLIYFSDIYFYFNLSGMRQAIAISFLLIASLFIVNRKPLYFLLFVFMATLFHKTAVIFILAYGVNFIELNKKNVLIILFSALICTVFIPMMISYISSIGYFRSVELYTSDSYNSTFSFSEYIVGEVKRLLPLLILFLFNSLSSFKHNVYVKLYLFGVIFFSVLYPSFPDLTVRLSSYFIVFDMVLYSLLFTSTQKKSTRIIYFIIILLLTGYKIFSYSNTPTFIYNTVFSH